MKVQELRALLDRLPVTADVRPDWHDDPPDDSEPAVAIHGAAIGDDNGEPYLSIEVGLVYLDDIESVEDECHDLQGD
jgi:hypothetical protein